MLVFGGQILVLSLGLHPQQVCQREVPLIESESLANNLQCLENGAR